MVPLKTAEEIARMRIGGRILAQALVRLAQVARVGVRAEELDALLQGGE